MTYNLGDFFVSIMKALVNLANTLYDVINYRLSISWVKKMLNLVNADVSQIPDSISLLSIIASASAILIITLILYNIFKP